MALRTWSLPPFRVDQPLLVEFGFVTVLLTGVFLWRRFVVVARTALLGPLPTTESLLLTGLVSGGLLVGGVVGLAAAYVRIRDLDVGLRRPTRADLPFVVLAALAPPTLVGSTKLVGTVTGVPYNSLTMTSYAADAPLAPVATLAGLGLLVGVPTLVAVCQVFVQASVTRAVEDDGAIVLTTLLAGFLVGSSTGGLSVAPELGRLVGAAVGVVALGVGVYGRKQVAHVGLRYLTYVPAVTVAGAIVLASVAEVDSVAGGLFAATHLAVLGVAAYTYSRTDSLVVPALAYGCLSVSNAVVVYAFEAGLQSW
ncbi:hypothetical protein [Candidatus Halobonum tyrrellensis]|uniref:Uncharacterized protein n=1 Tax=Candidatus Halobonum tyrrellensis G22 TaxID=1324957 RepID=V4J427_9EURY|nr:hypothetical protein [Candidatus Halobonum tyrrellensis]ESP90132.1 hypothetical protein K933_01187 [Candidatus Halobonum tyrrellensis G22]